MKTYKDDWWLDRWPIVLTVLIALVVGFLGGYLTCLIMEV